MPRKNRFKSPLREIRRATGQSQQDFARRFGTSTSNIQKIELGKRKISDELIDGIAVELGIDPESLVERRGKPWSLVGSSKVAYTTWDSKRYLQNAPNAEPSAHLAEMAKLFDEHHALQKITDPNERLRRSILHWQKITPHWDWRGARKALCKKLALLFQVAEDENKHLALAVQLDRWIKDRVREFRLKMAMTERNADWQQPFIETLADFKPLWQRREERAPVAQRRKKR